MSQICQILANFKLICKESQMFYQCFRQEAGIVYAREAVRKPKQVGFSVSKPVHSTLHQSG